MYQVVELAGTDRERQVFEAETYQQCEDFVYRHYRSGDQTEELGVDILKDGSTEY
jgi:hypothetical protein